MSALSRSALTLSIALGGLLLCPSVAHASNCVKIDEERDSLSPEERNSVRTLFEGTLTEEHQEVSRDQCTDTWTLYHARLGESITVVVQSSHGTRAEPARNVADTEPCGVPGATTSASDSPSSAPTRSSSSSDHAAPPFILRCACAYDRPIASASQADWRYFGSPWRSSSARTQRTASKPDGSPAGGAAAGAVLIRREGESTEI